MKSQGKKGSFTVEASLLMTIFIPLIVSLIYLGFYLHDRACLQGAAYEIAGAGLLCDSTEEAVRAMEAKRRELSRGMLFDKKAIQYKLEGNEKELRVCLYGEVQIPGIVSLLFPKSRLTIRGETSRKRERGTSTILKLSRMKRWKEGEQKHGASF